MYGRPFWIMRYLLPVKDIPLSKSFFTQAAPIRYACSLPRAACRLWATGSTAYRRTTAPSPCGRMPCNSITPKHSSPCPSPSIPRKRRRGHGLAGERKKCGSPEPHFSYSRNPFSAFVADFKPASAERTTSSLISTARRRTVSVMTCFFFSSAPI